jgi:glycosyltransferase involved in cell wall biosynthesis
MRPLKIALLSRSYWLESHIHYDEEGGGATQQLAEAVAARGHEVVVLSQSSEVRKLKKIQIGALETWVSPRDKHRSILTALRDRRVRKTYSHPTVYSDARVLREFLARRGPFDVLWAHTESPDGLVAAIAAQLAGRKLPPILLQIQALRCRFEKGAPVFTEKQHLSLAFRHAARILTPSEMVFNSLLAYTGPGLTAENLRDKVRMVYPNLQRSFLRAAQESPSAPMTDRVLFLGALNQTKGAPVFMKALPKTEAAKRNTIFVVIGDFTEYNKRFIQRWEEAKENVRVHLTGARIEYLGKVTSFEVLRQIKLASVVVIPSLFNAFSRGLVEALVLGRPVITTDKVGAAPLVIANQSGIVIAPNDPTALAHAIDAVLSPMVPFAAMAQQTGLRLIHDFSPETIAEQSEYNLSRIVAPPK